jgi:hypothetical protein
MFNFDFFRRKKISALTSKFLNTILNSKTTYLVVLFAILIQFILVGIIFFQNKKNAYLIERTNSKTEAIESQQRIIDEKINGLSANLMRMSAQLYRMQAGVK